MLLLMAGGRRGPKGPAAFAVALALAAGVVITLTTFAPVDKAGQELPLLAVPGWEGPEPAPALPVFDEPEPDPVVLADPVRVRVPAIGVDADLVAVGLKPDGAMLVPDFGLAGWYDLGPKPGASGPAVIAAHVDSKAGPDVFYRLRELAPGDVIEVEYSDGFVTRFAVESMEQRLKTELPIDKIWNETEDAVLRLITCGGEFDQSRRSYRSNVIVYASTAGS